MNTATAERTEEATFVWTPELIAAVAADMDRGLALDRAKRWDLATGKYVPVARPRSC